jgi:hypothetical protein
VLAGAAPSALAPTFVRDMGPTFVQNPGPTFVQNPGPTFVRVRGNADVFWQLLARDLARFGGAFASLASRRFSRMAGDLAVQGKGELIVPS